MLGYITEGGAFQKIKPGSLVSYATATFSTMDSDLSTCCFLMLMSQQVGTLS